MKRSLLFLVFISLFTSLAAQSPYTVSGGSGTPVDTIINGMEVCLVNGLSGARITFTSSNPGTHQWYRYKTNANNAEAIPCVQTGNTSYIIAGANGLQDGYGYFVNFSSQEPPHYIWIIDYSLHLVSFSSIDVIANDNQCTSLTVSAIASADPLNFYSPSGSLGSLMRTYILQYSTVVWDGDTQQFLPNNVTMNLSAAQISNVMVPAPLANTYYTLTGDQYAAHFGIQQTINSSEYQAVSVEAHYSAVTDKEPASNEVYNANDVMGGSAPITYTFTAYANDPVAQLYIWKISQQDSLGNVTPKVRFTDKILQYTFDQNGTYIVSLEVSDGQSVCVDTTQTFTVIVDNTLLQIPNAFSPGSSIGVNDELKVAYTSVISFKAYVYNRWGNLLFQWSDPSKGWDGRVSGRFVPTGVYYVVVEYKDSNGKNRVAKQAVNILRSKNQTQ